MVKKMTLYIEGLDCEDEAKLIRSIHIKIS